MKWIKRAALFLLVAVVGLFVLQWFASETTGEVIVLNTTDDAGEPHDTRLWVVDHTGNAWLRAGGESAWFARLTNNPTVSMTRDGETKTYTATTVSQASVRDTVNSLMQSKYGWGDQFISKLMDRSSAIAVRLDPIAE